MLVAMARPSTRKPVAKRPVAATNPNTEALYIRTTEATFDALTEWVNELNAAAEMSGDPRRWTKNDLVNAILARRLKARTPGEMP